VSVGVLIGGMLGVPTVGLISGLIDCSVGALA